ncbi:Vmc-like lipoprotein signal peptide domain-containing protein [Ureaplasma diversum]|uniref:Vmc-like lipoprotein signal peptide domain-containing protein n=1 Tax=Ureaplasma diversum TaxID=42094 RepID=UPI0012DE6A06|nr:hypothetical protein [Ureaplasma diversum]
MSKFINKKGLILMVSTILIGSSIVAVAAACNDKTPNPSKNKETNTQQSSSSTPKDMTGQEDKMKPMAQAEQTNKQTNKQ